MSGEDDFHRRSEMLEMIGFVAVRGGQLERCLQALFVALMGSPQAGTPIGADLLSRGQNARWLFDNVEALAEEVARFHPEILNEDLRLGVSRAVVSARAAWLARNRVVHATWDHGLTSPEHYRLRQLEPTPGTPKTPAALRDVGIALAQAAQQALLLADLVAAAWVKPRSPGGV